MADSPRRIAIIPARAGSKRIPGKNVREVAGRPLIEHVIAAAAASGLFDVIHVSTDSAEIAALAERNGASSPFLRPAALADDHTGLEHVLRWVLAALSDEGVEFEVACNLLPTAALVDADDLRAGAVRHESDPSRRPALAVAHFPAPVERALRSDGEALRPADRESFMRRSQDLEPAYYDTGTFMFFDPQSLVEGRHAAQGYLPVVLPPWKAVDVDEPVDLELLERLMVHTRSR